MVTDKVLKSASLVCFDRCEGSQVRFEIHLTCLVQGLSNFLEGLRFLMDSL